MLYLLPCASQLNLQQSSEHIHIITNILSFLRSVFFRCRTCSSVLAVGPFSLSAYQHYIPLHLQPTFAGLYCAPRQVVCMIHHCPLYLLYECAPPKLREPLLCSYLCLSSSKAAG